MNRMQSTYWLLILTLSAPMWAFGQVDSLPVMDYTERGDYEIAAVEVTGAENRDRNAIRSIAGLRVGDKIAIPGPNIPKAIKSLWKLRLFEDVKVLQDSTVGNLVYLRIYLKERPILSRFTYRGVGKGKHSDLNDIVNGIMTKGGIVTEDQKILAELKIKEFFVEKGKLDARVQVDEQLDELNQNAVKLIFNIDEGERVKVQDILFVGNEEVSDRKLRKRLKGTKRKGTLFKKTKYVKDKYAEDKKNLVEEYRKEGFRDANITKDSIWREADGDLMIKLWVDEGNRYYFRDITWKGNSLYTDEQLTTILGIVKGDVYNPELLESRLRFSQDGRDISSLYLDDGYLFFDVQPVEVSVLNDSVDIEMQIFEGPQATIENVVINGNDRTNEDVIRRVLRTRPGEKFSRSDIVRSQREIINLGYFNPETLDMQTPVNPQRGTVDIIYNVEERPSDQLELSAGYGGFNGLIGTLGVTFNNFSLANVRDRSTWSPLPQGDGQKLSLRAQSNSRFFRSYNFSFTDPWLGGKKPNSFTIGGFRTTQDFTTLGRGSLVINRGFVALGSQLRWPDDYFSTSTSLSIENIILSDFGQAQFQVEGAGGQIVPITNGSFKNFSITQTLTRSSISDPLFPRRGSRISLSLKFTPPYSLFRSDNNFTLTDDEIAQVIRDLTMEFGPADPPTQADIEREIFSRENAKRFEFLEYHKWTFNGEWYFNLFDKLVLMTQAKFGLVGAYNDEIGISPFERFELGGDGLNNQNVGIVARDIIALRGYEVNEIPQNGRGGATIYDKFTVELRYPLSLNPNSTIFVTTFLQGGNAWARFSDFNPFEMRRSVGVGMRVFLPMFGLLGFNYGWGFDKDLPEGAGLGEYGQFNIILGFEPE